MRERELKPEYLPVRGMHGKSLPMRERELKPTPYPYPRQVAGRSPCGSVN